MPLPKISTPTYELVIPSSQKKIKYRPFLVKEEKILVIAQESGDKNQIMEAMKNVVNDCILTRGVKVDDLATFDLEYIFLNIRGKSVGETVEVLITCPDDNETQVPVTINLEDIKVNIDEKHSRDIKLDDSLVLRMKYPSIKEFVEKNFVEEEELSVEDTFDMICSCVDQVYNEEESWSASECTKEELSDFIGQLSSKQFKQVELFFQTMPKLSHKLKIKNPNTEVEREVVLEGLTSFFA